MKKFKVLFLLILLIGTLTMISCDVKPSNDQKQAKQTEKSLSEALRQIGMPAITNFQELKRFKQILELRDQANLITYTYLFNAMTGKVGQFLGKSIGFGIPASTQFTNPMKVTKGLYSGHQVVLPQPDPNGLFMPTSSTATWVMLLDSKGNPHPMYVEPLIIVSTFPLDSK